jgi:hypothetical protein
MAILVKRSTMLATKRIRILYKYLTTPSHSLTDEGATSGKNAFAAFRICFSISEIAVSRLPSDPNRNLSE